MKRIEITHRKEMNELEKLAARLERAEKTLAKKKANAEKYGVSEWETEDRNAWLATVETKDGWIVNKADIDRNGAWIDLSMANREVEDIKGRIAKAEIRLAKAEEEVEKYHKEIEAIEDLQRKEELWKLEFEEEQNEWLKDGIHLEGRYYGTTPNGKHFYIERNHGWTERSLHCFTLTIDGETIFTSGEFWRAYGIIKKS